MDLEIKDHDHGGWTAVASSPSRDRDGEIVDFRAFDPLPASVPSHLGHDWSRLAGSCKPFYRGSELWVEGRFATNTHGTEARALVTQGHLQSMSVVMANTKKSYGDDGFVHITSAELVACDLVSIPANREARILTSRAYRPTHESTTAESALAQAKATLARLDAEALLRDLDKSPHAALASAKHLMRETAAVKIPSRAERVKDNVVHSWPAGENPVLPRGKILSLGVKQGFRQHFVRGRGLARTPCEYEVFVEYRNGGWSNQRQWFRFKDNPGVLEYQGGDTPNQTVGESFTVSRTFARDVSLVNDPNFDPDRKTTVKLPAPIDF